MPHDVDIVPVPVESRKNCIVVGGGVAGMEAARVLALRGHAVTLYEMGAHLGGQVRIAQRAGWRRDLGYIADWLEAEINRLGVQIRLGEEATCEEIRGRFEESGGRTNTKNVVIYAAGGLPTMSIQYFI